MQTPSNFAFLKERAPLFVLNKELEFESSVHEFFHSLRIEGNKANHQFRTLHIKLVHSFRLLTQVVNA